MFKFKHKKSDNPEDKYQNSVDTIQREYDYLFKIVIVGDSSVGKSCLLLRFADDMWTNNYIATIGVDFRFRTIDVDNKTVKLQIWDTAGHERFHSINASYYRNCDGAILCYDVSRPDTFKNITYHLEQVQEKGEKNAAKILVANKCDMKESRKVSFDDGVDLSHQLHLPFFEISSKYNKNVDESFEELARQCIANKEAFDTQKYEQQQQLEQLNKQPKSNKISLKQIKRGIKDSGCC